MHLLTQSALLKALGWSLFNSFWQMALLWLLYRVLLAIFPKASAHARHGLACLVLGAGVVWAALSGTSPWPDGLFQAGDHLGTSFWQAGREFINGALPYCSFLYLLALAFLFTRYTHQYLQSMQLKKEGLSKIQPGLRVFVAETSRLMGIRQEVNVWLSSLIEVPVTLGFLKPVILIPLATANNLSLQQVEAILLHELAHIKRNDYLLHLGVTVLEVLFFFNPFSRLLIRDIKREREHRCDDMVMQFRYDPHTYVSALLALATATANGQGRSQRRLALAATGGSDRLLLQRVKRILQPGETKDRLGARALIFLLLTLAGTFMLVSRSAYPGSRGLAETILETTTPSLSGNSASPSIPVLSVERDFPAGPILGTTRHASVVSVRKPPVTKTTKKHPPVLAEAEVADPDEGPASEEGVEAEFATVVQPDDREYSMSPTVSITLAAPAKRAVIQRQPFVPNSSFSFQHVEDTIRLKEQYAYLQSLASHEVEEAVKKMQKELKVQLRVLQMTPSKELQAALQAQRQILEEQLKLQELFLRKQQGLERRLERAGKVRRIVVI
ncbi:MAG TPA: M56 family metallopeptidase [Puia sp.]